MIVPVKPFRLRAIADPMLDHGRDAHWRHAGRAALEPFHIGARQAGDGCGVGTECRGKAGPARLAAHIGLGRQRHMDADGTIFLPRNITEPADEIGVVQRRKSQRIGPQGKATARRARADRGLKMVARISADRCRNAQPCAFRDFLHHIVLAREFRRLHHDPGDEAVDLPAFDHGAHPRHVIAGRRHADRRSMPRQARMHHQADFFLDGHARHQVIDPLLDRQARILIAVEFVVAVQIPPLRRFRRGGDQRRGQGKKPRDTGRSQHYAPIQLFQGHAPSCPAMSV